MSVKNRARASGVHWASLRWVIFLLVAMTPALIVRAAPTMPDARMVLASPANLVTVTTTSDVADGDTSSFANLNKQHGPDGAISLREAMRAANATSTAILTLTIAFSIPIAD